MYFYRYFPIFCLRDMAELKIGDRAPQIEAYNQDGELFSLASLLGSRVVLYFYPKDNTPGCTMEAKSLQDGLEELSAAGFKVVGVSPDSVRSHRNFCDKHSLQFTLLADTDHSVAEAYGVWGEKKMMGRVVVGIRRTTFIIDAEGKIQHIFTKVQTKEHQRQILDWYAQQQ